MEDKERERQQVALLRTCIFVLAAICLSNAWGAAAGWGIVLLVMAFKD